MMENIGVRFPNSVGRFLICHFFFFFPAPTKPGSQNFIIPAPQSNTWVVAQTLDVVNSFLFYIFLKRGIVRKHGTCKHKNLPDKNYVFVAYIIEPVIFVNTATPNAQHIKVGDLSGVNNLLIHLISYTGFKNIVWNVIRSFHKYRNTIQFEVERSSFFVFIANQFKGADTNTIILFGGSSVNSQFTCDVI